MVSVRGKEKFVPGDQTRRGAAERKRPRRRRGRVRGGLTLGRPARSKVHLPMDCSVARRKRLAERNRAALSERRPARISPKPFPGAPFHERARSFLIVTSLFP